MNRLLRAAALAALPLGLLARAFAPGGALAGTALRMPIEDLARRAELCVEGRVLAKRPFRDERGLVRTEFTLSVQRTFAGEPFGTRTFEMPGGVLADGSGTAISGLPAIELGEDVLLFLSGESRRGLRMPIGLAQGKLGLVRDGEGRLGLVPSSAEMMLVDPRTNALAPAGAPVVLDYETVVQRIDAALRAKAEGR